MGREFCIHQSWDGTGKWEGRGNGRGREIAFISRRDGTRTGVGRDADGTDERSAVDNHHTSALRSVFPGIDKSWNILGNLKQETSMLTYNILKDDTPKSPRVI